MGSRKMRWYFVDLAADVDDECRALTGKNLIVPGSVNEWVPYKGRIDWMEAEQVACQLDVGQMDWPSVRHALQWFTTNWPHATLYLPTGANRLDKMMRAAANRWFPLQLLVDSYQSAVLYEEWSALAPRGFTVIHGRSESTSENRRVFISEEEAGPKGTDDLDQRESDAAEPEGSQSNL